MDWTETNSYLKGVCNRIDSDNFDNTKPIRIAAFDLDDTLILHPKGSNHKTWNLLDKNAGKKIRDLIEEKYLIVVFTNQSGMSRNAKFDKLQWRKNTTEIMKKLVSKIDHYYLAVYASKTHDIYRKPNTGMWEQMKIDLRTELELDDNQRLRLSANSFYCGDAAGRTEASIFRKRLYPSSKKDFSDTDRKFAHNLRLKFMTPEEFYLRDYIDETPWEFSGLDPNEYLDNIGSNTHAMKYVFKPRKREMIVMVGPPGSGKSTFVKKYLEKHNYVVVNRDTHKTKNKCVAVTNTALVQGKSVVIDNTNYDIPSRMTYTLLAKRHGYEHVRCIILQTDVALAKHLANVRHVYSGGTVPQISNIVYNIYNKSYVEPDRADGFDIIEKVNFTFDPRSVDEKWMRCFKKLSES